MIHLQDRRCAVVVHNLEIWFNALCFMLLQTKMGAQAKFPPDATTATGLWTHSADLILSCFEGPVSHYVNDTSGGGWGSGLLCPVWSALCAPMADLLIEIYWRAKKKKSKMFFNNVPCGQSFLQMSMWTPVGSDTVGKIHHIYVPPQPRPDGVKSVLYISSAESFQSEGPAVSSGHIYWCWTVMFTEV